MTFFTFQKKSREQTSERYVTRDEILKLIQDEVRKVLLENPVGHPDSLDKSSTDNVNENAENEVSKEKQIQSAEHIDISMLSENSFDSTLKSDVKSSYSIDFFDDISCINSHIKPISVMLSVFQNGNWESFSDRLISHAAYLLGDLRFPGLKIPALEHTSVLACMLERVARKNTYLMLDYNEEIVKQVLMLLAFSYSLGKTLISCRVSAVVNGQQVYRKLYERLDDFKKRIESREIRVETTLNNYDLSFILSTGRMTFSKFTGELFFKVKNTDDERLFIRYMNLSRDDLIYKILKKALVLIHTKKDTGDELIEPVRPVFDDIEHTPADWYQDQRFKNLKGHFPDDLLARNFKCRALAMAAPLGGEVTSLLKEAYDGYDKNLEEEKQKDRRFKEGLDVLKKAMLEDAEKRHHKTLELCSKSFPSSNFDSLHTENERLNSKKRRELQDYPLKERELKESLTSPIACKDDSGASDDSSQTEKYKSCELPDDLFFTEKTESEKAVLKRKPPVKKTENTVAVMHNSGFELLDNYMDMFEMVFSLKDEQASAKRVLTARESRMYSLLANLLGFTKDGVLSFSFSFDTELKQASSIKEYYDLIVNLSKEVLASDCSPAKKYLESFLKQEASVLKKAPCFD
ncbi:MAG: hypothetical protein ACI4NE_03840 [Succinivibrio sp.]